MNKSLKAFFNVKDPVNELKLNNASHARLEHQMTKAALFGLMKRFEPGDKLIQQKAEKELQRRLAIKTSNQPGKNRHANTFRERTPV